MTDSDVYRVLGLMSGTSLDGLDLAYCHFFLDQGNWRFELKEARTVNYELDWKHRLRQAPELNAQEIHLLDIAYAQWLAQQVSEFKQDFDLAIDFVASHGHTIFHQPGRQMTLQIGAGWVLALETQISVIANFRVMDVALGGQGAPLVPIGDHHLFSDYDCCLNLGGIANMSFLKEGQRKAYDICPLNMALNFLAKILNFEYDKNGEISRQGTVQNELLIQLNQLSYYQESFPKSLSWEWFSKGFLPTLNAFSAPIPDKLATCVEHFSEQISRELN
ncbi:MAG: anhydro-N-acetylmuramic acid kinase, partial [Bacteroidota bacterium]